MFPHIPAFPLKDLCQRNTSVFKANLQHFQIFSLKNSSKGFFNSKTCHIKCLSNKFISMQNNILGLSQELPYLKGLSLFLIAQILYNYLLGHYDSFRSL